MAETQIYVGAVVREFDRILFVRQSPGHSLEGQWTLPWGRVEPGESPAAAAIREANEEGGVVAEIEGLLGIQELPSPQLGSFGLAYLCPYISGNPVPMCLETDAAAYYSVEELAGTVEPLEWWSRWLAKRVFSGEYTVAREDASNPLRSSGSYL